MEKKDGRRVIALVAYARNNYTVTALNPVLGYEKATELAQEAYKSGKGILEVIREKKVLTEQQITELLDPIKLTNLDPNQYKR